MSFRVQKSPTGLVLQKKRKVIAAATAIEQHKKTHYSYYSRSLSFSAPSLTSLLVHSLAFEAPFLLPRKKMSSIFLSFSPCVICLGLADVPIWRLYQCGSIVANWSPVLATEDGYCCKYWLKRKRVKHLNTVTYLFSYYSLALVKITFVSLQNEKEKHENPSLPTRDITLLCMLYNLDFTTFFFTNERRV